MWNFNSLFKKKTLNKKNCEMLSKLIYNRGPDKILKEYFYSGKLFIANSILSITGKIKKNSNLYKSKNSKYAISFNGEIYNYKNLSNKYLKNKYPLNDTDVLVNLYNTDTHYKIAKKLDGMFAYCVYDKKEKVLKFATDVQGEKKLFYFENDDYFIACSNLQPILKFTKDIDYVKLKEYFETRHFIFAGNTVYKNIKYFKQGFIYQFNLKTLETQFKKFDDPINWIQKKTYLKMKNLNEGDLKDYFLNILIKSKEKMIPKIPFASFFSGGIDSSLSSKLLSSSKNLKKLIFVDHGNKKDPISHGIRKFNKYLNKKIFFLKLDEKKYALKLKNIYSSLQLPFHSHDLVGIDEVFKYAKKNKLRVIFNGGGVDEIWGGYKLYKSTNWSKNYYGNLSPYSSFKKIFNTKDTKSKKITDKLWLRAYKKYSKFLNKKDSKIQASLFVDYFIQGIGVHNFSWHILSGENSVEVRNFFINKTILSKIINVPIEHRINLKVNNKFALKKLLKIIFVTFFPKKLVFKKQGFSGFPNESSKFLNKRDKKEFYDNLNIFKNKIKITRDNYWKILNLYYFKKYIYPKMNFNKILN